MSGCLETPFFRFYQKIVQKIDFYLIRVRRGWLQTRDETGQLSLSFLNCEIKLEAWIAIVGLKPFPSHSSKPSQALGLGSRFMRASNLI